MNQIPADIIVYAIIAVGLVLWLRSILGTRHGDERQRPDPFKPQPKQTESTNTNEQEDNIIPLPTGSILSTKSQNNPHKDYAEQTAQQGLLQIALTDRQFDAMDFIEKAQDAFSMIINAFAEGNRETLRDLLADPVYKAFDNAIREREKKGETVTTEVHAIRNVRVIEAGLSKKRHATLTLRFTADETCVIRNKDGEIITGHPDRVTEMIDVWVFGRDVKSADPRWLLIETRDDVVEDHDSKTPIPEA